MNESLFDLSEENKTFANPLSGKKKGFFNSTRYRVIRKLCWAAVMQGA